MPKPAAFAALAALLVAAPALAQSPSQSPSQPPSQSPPSPSPSEWAAPQLKEMDAVFGQPIEGLTFEGSAPSGEIGVVKVTLPAAGRYAFVGACGGDCVDIGLILDHDGKPVAQGVTGFKSALGPGEYELKIGFDQCKEAKCRYVVRVYKAG